MSEDAPTADDIKAMLSLARKRELHFAICLGKKPEGSLLLIDKIKAPEALARKAKKLGETNKVAFGVIAAEGKQVNLTCHDKPPSGLALKTKKFLASINIPAQISLFDINGAEIEDAEETEAPAQPSAEAAKEPPQETSPDAKRWELLSAKLDGLISAYSGDKADQIKAAWAAAQQAAREGKHAQALKVGMKLAPALSSSNEPADLSAARADLKAAVDKVKEIAAINPRVTADITPLIQEATTLLKADDPAAVAAVERVEERVQNWMRIADEGFYHPFQDTLAELEAQASKLMAAFPKVKDPAKQIEIVQALERIREKIETGEAKLRA
ncbi:MAG: hypothetical protein AB8B60_18410 [Sulfitobacter sp.]